jgi:predicted dehydrogenase
MSQSVNSKATTSKVAILGCGQIADAHLQELRYVPGVQVVAVCDQLQELADQAARRFDVPGAFTDLERMLTETRPDAVHVTTPPHTHASLACQLLNQGVNVYVEKPFTVDVAEADEVFSAARRNGKLVCVGHDHLFDPVWLRLQKLVTTGQLGDIVHVDSVMGYNLNGPFGKIMFNDPHHWLHRLPGGLFHNNISHAIYKITPFLSDELPRIHATTDRPTVGRPPTELRVMLQGESVTANIRFSSRARPVQRLATLYGTKASVEVDLEARTIRWCRSAKLPGALGKLDVPWQQLREAAGNLRRNTWDFLRCRQHYFAGMRELFTRFYAAIRAEQEPPIPYEEIRRVTAWMDEIFRQCKLTEADVPASIPDLVGQA